MLYYIIFRIYVILFFILFGYGIFASCYYPSTELKYIVRDPFFWRKREILFPEEKKWKDERINAFIFCVITLALFIMVWILSFYRNLIYNYLSFNFDNEKNEENNELEIKRKVSIQTGSISCNFEIIHNKDFCLKAKAKSKIYFFKQVIFNNEIYYLKCNNIALKDQLSCDEMKYPDSNLIVVKLANILYAMMASLFFIILTELFKSKNEDVAYDYFLYLMDLGFQPKEYKYFQKSKDINSKYDGHIKYIYSIFGIIIMLAIAKWAVFGGFKNKIFLWISILLTFIFAILNIVLIGIYIYMFIYNFLGFICIVVANISFTTIYMIVETIIAYNLNLFILIIVIIVFFLTIKLLIRFLKLIIQNYKLGKVITSEDEIKYISLNNDQWILEAVNSNDALPKHLFYTKKANPNPVPFVVPQITISTETILCLEKKREILLDKNESKDLFLYKYKAFNTKRIISKTISNIIQSVIVIILIIIIILLYSFNKDTYYEAYRIQLIYAQNFGHEILNTFTKFWLNLGQVEHQILSSFLTFTILFLVFEIGSLIIHLNLFPIDYKNGIFYQIILLTNIIFYVIFEIFVPLIFFLIIYSLLVMIFMPQKIQSGQKSREDWKERRFDLLVNLLLKIILLICSSYLLRIKYSIIDYLNKNYEQEENKKEEDEYEYNEEDYDEDIEKNEINTSITIQNNNYNAKMQLNNFLLIQKVGDKDKTHIYQFKKIFIQNITPHFVYIRLGINTITDIFANADWNYPKMNLIFTKLSDMVHKIYLIIFFSVPIFKLNVEKEISYQNLKLIHKNKIKRPLFTSVFDKYGSYEKSFHESRFSLYMIQLCILLFFMLKRIYFGGFKKVLYLKIVFIISIIFLIQNIIYTILDLLTIALAIMSLINLLRTSGEGAGMLQAKLYLQCILNLFIFIQNIRLLVDSIKFTYYLNKVRNGMNRFNNQEDNIDDEDKDFKPEEFKYISLDGAICNLKEFKHELLQRYLFYDLESEEVQENKEERHKNENEIVIHETKKNNLNNKNTDSIKLNINDNDDFQHTSNNLKLNV